MTYLLIDTSTERGFVGVCQNQRILEFEELPRGLQSSRHFFEILQELSTQPQEFSCVGVGVGPGSYTGIRVGVAVAKCISFTLGIPLVGASSLTAFPSERSSDFYSVLDARSGGFYVQKGQYVEKTVIQWQAPQLLNEKEMELLKGNSLVGPDGKKILCRLNQLYPEENWTFEEVSPSISSFAREVEEQRKLGKERHDGSLEILYLRQTQAEREKKNEAQSFKDI